MPIDIPPIDHPNHFSYWATPPNSFENHRSSSVLPEETDVVIIGSGFSGASIAYHLLVDDSFNHAEVYPNVFENIDSGKSKKLRVVMLEARQITSAASGRNGGHLHPGFDYGCDNEIDPETNSVKCSASERDACIDKINFDLLNYKAVEQLVKKNQIDGLHSTFTDPVESTDSKKQQLRAAGCAIFDNEAHFKHTCLNISHFLNTKSPEPWSNDYDKPPIHIYTKEEAQRQTGLASIVGAIQYPATPISAYKLSTWMIVHAMCVGNLNLQTTTPVTSVTKEETTHYPKYTVHTPRGPIRAAVVIFATNAYTNKVSSNVCKESTQSHGIGVAVPTRLRTKIYPVRGQVAAYRVPRHLTSLPLVPRDGQEFDNKKCGKLSLVWKDEYMAVMPVENNDEKQEMVDIVYGGCRRYGKLQQVGYIDDNATSDEIETTLDDFLRLRFGIPLKNDQDDNLVDKLQQLDIQDDKPVGKTTKPIKLMQWTGVMGFTEDSNPCVGSMEPSNTLLVNAGFGGHGMPRIFMSARALVHKYLCPSHEAGCVSHQWPNWFPKDYIN